MDPARPTPWWRGARGEWYVAGQLALMALIFFGPRQWHGWPALGFPWPALCRIAGLALMAAGASLLGAGIFSLGGNNLTPNPRPRAQGTLVESGAFGLVRHPLYSGGIVLAIGWALVRQSLLTLAYVAVLVVFIDVKARREERWLAEKFPGYDAYRRRVARFIPFLY